MHHITKTILSAAVLLLTLLSPVGARSKHIVVEAGSAESLLNAISEANRLNADSLSDRLFILVPDGIYDLADRTLTLIEGHNISIVGQSMEGTIIMNAPDVANEGIRTTATLRNQTTGLHLQDLTLKNNLDYYSSGAAGRAVCLQDRGTNTICSRVRMLSFQDTYYSDNEEAHNYFDHSEIHGTVDFICGAGDVFFNQCTIVTERRTRDGKGRCVIAAPRTSKTQWGYVFDGCTIRNDLSQYHLARGWHTQPKCVWLNTTLTQPELLRAERFDPASIRSVDCAFGEYGTKDATGGDITPQSNIITIVAGENSNTVQTTLTEAEAARFTVENVFPQWRPDRVLRQLEKKSARLKRKYL